MNAKLRPLAQFKAAVEHFVVRETLSFEPSGSGEHQYLLVRKRGLNTSDVAARIARQAGVPTRDVGYAGMKDKWAVADQWFSVAGSDFDVAGFGEEQDEELAVLTQSRHEKKLKRGAVAKNSFEILLTGVADVPPIEDTRFPNYFGPQRLGQDNVARAKAWIVNRRRRRISPFKQGLYLSVLRSVLFNAVLDMRVNQGNWCEPLSGDVLDEEGNPTAPMWGRGRSATAGEAAEIEAAALAPFEKIMEALEFAGVVQGRRSLLARAEALVVESDADGDVRLAFDLPSGSYATVFLAQHFELHDVSLGE